MRPSPGYENTETGIAAYEASLQEDEDIGVYINEFMASNATTVADAYGAYSDWIELYNSNAYEVDLSGFGISDSISQPKKYTLPEGTVIPANGYLVIFCSGNEGFTESGELHAPFGLRAYAEDVVFSSKRGTILDSYSYTVQETDYSMARVPDGTGEFAATAHPTPGYANDDAGYQAFSASVTRAKSDVYISEAIAKNLTAKAAPDGNYYDCIELHNRGSETVSLSGCALSDNPKNPAKWVFPEGISLAPGEYLVVYASENNSKVEKGDLHTNFNLSADGASIYLFDANGLLVDKLQTGAFLGDMSYGIDADGNYACFETATLGAANGAGQKGVTAMVQFLTTPGIYEGEIEIALSAPAGETIHYTLDCTTPTESSPVYEGPIKASSNTVVRAISVREGYVTNYSVSGTFLFRSDDVNHALPTPRTSGTKRRAFMPTASSMTRILPMGTPLPPPITGNPSRMRMPGSARAALACLMKAGSRCSPRTSACALRAALAAAVRRKGSTSSRGMNMAITAWNTPSLKTWILRSINPLCCARARRIRTAANSATSSQRGCWWAATLIFSTSPISPMCCI